MLPDNNVEENLSLAYATVVSSMAGYELYMLSKDWGVDAQLAEVMKVDGSVEDTGVYVSVQLKACKNTRDLGQKIAYDIKNKARNKLTKTKTNAAVPKILVVLCLDTQKSNWMKQDLSQLIVKKCAYWYYLEGMPKVPNDDHTTVLHIPKENVFSPENIQKIMNCVKTGGDLHDL